VVDLPPEASQEFRSHCREFKMYFYCPLSSHFLNESRTEWRDIWGSDGLTVSRSFVPLIAPTTSDERLQYIDTIADSFVYCVSLLGVTGGRTALSNDLASFVSRYAPNASSLLASMHPNALLSTG